MPEEAPSVPRSGQGSERFHKSSPVRNRTQSVRALFTSLRRSGIVPGRTYYYISCAIFKPVPLLNFAPVYTGSLGCGGNVWKAHCSISRESQSQIHSHLSPYAANGRLGHTAFLTVHLAFPLTSGAALTCHHSLAIQGPFWQ